MESIYEKIIIIAISILISPFLAICAALLFGKNIFDNSDFWYGYMSFFGTVLLGAVAMAQNQKVHNINDKLLQMQEESQRFQIKEKASPISITPIILDKHRNYYVICDDSDFDEFDVVNQKYEYIFFMECPLIEKDKANLYNMVIEIENISDIILKEIYIENFKLYDIITNSSGVPVEKENIREYIYENKPDQSINCILKPHEKMKMCFKIDMDGYDLSEESFHLNFDISTMSIYNVIFSENINMMRNNVVDKVDRVFLNVDRVYFVNMPEAIEN